MFVLEAHRRFGKGGRGMKFPDLVTHIAEVDDMARMNAGRLVQQALSLRNWVIGAGIVEFEQSGEDRAAYGDRLLMRLSDALMGYYGANRITRCDHID
jgi:hypothetical protein